MFKGISNVISKTDKKLIAKLFSSLDSLTSLTDFV